VLQRDFPEPIGGSLAAYADSAMIIIKMKLFQKTFAALFIALPPPIFASFYNGRLRA
jgi:hypothetical protein